MDVEIGFIGKTIAKNDEIIKQSLKNVLEKEDKIIKNYKSLTEFRGSFPPEVQNFLGEFDKEIEKHKLYLQYKIQSKEKQIESLYKVLEYINYLDEKDKNLQSQLILNKIKNIEESMLQYKRIF
tara:strand:- start:323 stop:694 length:372 start_codon:yes stop_codon:yes gene_type:complete